MLSVSMHIYDPATRLVARTLLESAGISVLDGVGGDVAVYDRLQDTQAVTDKTKCLYLCPKDGVAEAVKLMRDGLFGYVLLPFVPGELELMVRRAAKTEVDTPQIERPLRLMDMELEHISDVLRSCKYNQAEAARQLGIGRNTLWRKMKRLKLDSTGKQQK